MANVNIEIRICMIRVLDTAKFLKEANIKFEDDRVFKIPTKEVKALFHFWHPITGNGIVECEDGTIHEIEPTQIRFVDNAMSEYAFPEMEQTKI